MSRANMVQISKKELAYKNSLFVSLDIAKSDVMWHHHHCRLSNVINFMGRRLILIWNEKPVKFRNQRESATSKISERKTITIFTKTTTTTTKNDNKTIYFCLVEMPCWKAFIVILFYFAFSLLLSFNIAVLLHFRPLFYFWNHKIFAHSTLRLGQRGIKREIK